MSVAKTRNGNWVNSATTTDSNESYNFGSDHIEEKQSEECAWKIWRKRRYVVAFLAFFGFFNVYALRVNLSIAIVAMTESKKVITNGTLSYEKEFDWDSKQQGYVLSSFFYGYIMTQLLGGWIATKYGGNKIYGLGIAVTSALTLVTPFAAKTNFYFLLAVRIIEGIFEGVVYPCIHAVWAKWAPPLERSRLVAISFSGSYFGTVVSMPLCAYLSEVLGWESIFYIFGTVGLIWYVCWTIIVAESPSKDKYISKEELDYILSQLGEPRDANAKKPWGSILKSAAVWGIIAAHFSENWGFYTLLTQLPKFMKDILHFELGKTGIMSALPYLAMCITLQIAGYLADWLQLKGILTTVQVRKLFTCGAFLAQTVFMLLAAFLLSPVGTTACLTLAVGLGGFAWAGFAVNYLDIAPQHASIMMGIGNTFGTLPGILSPIITGYVVTTPNGSEWQIVFFIGSGIYLVGCILYGCFASGTLQDWAIESKPLKSNENEKYDNPVYTPDI